MLDPVVLVLEDSRTNLFILHVVVVVPAVTDFPFKDVGRHVISYFFPF